MFQARNKMNQYWTGKALFRLGQSVQQLYLKTLHQKFEEQGCRFGGDEVNADHQVGVGKRPDDVGRGHDEPRRCRRGRPVFLQSCRQRFHD